MSGIRSTLELALGVLPEEEINALLKGVVTRTYPADFIICHEGQLEHIFYIIQSGQVAFTKQMTEGQQFLSIKGPGEFFGELGVLDHAPRAATAHAISECQLIEIEEYTLNGVLARNPSVVRKILQGVTRNVRDTDRIAIAELQLKNNELARTLENLRLAQAELLRRERLKRDLEIAVQVHKNILPISLPQIPGFEFAAAARPAREIGGDLYDVVDMGQNQVGIVMADASGKSVQAALYMAVLRALFLSETNANLSPAETGRRIHDLLMKVSTTADMFVTAFYAKLNYVTRQMCYIRAGHDRPIYYHADTGQVTLLDVVGRFLGLLPDLILEEQNLTFYPGDVLVCYSDGVTDAVHRNGGEMYGLERLKEIVGRESHRSAGELVEIIINEVDQFRDGEEQPDDLTLLITKAVKT